MSAVLPVLAVRPEDADQPGHGRGPRRRGQGAAGAAGVVRLMTATVNPNLGGRVMADDAMRNDGAKGGRTMTEKYGQWFWCIKVPKTLSPDGEIYVMADAVEVTPHGALILVRRGDGEHRPDMPNLALSPGQWIALFAASMIDGR